MKKWKNQVGVRHLMKNKEVEEYKQKVLAVLRNNLIYPKTTDEKKWEEAEKINSLILKAIDEIIHI